MRLAELVEAPELYFGNDDRPYQQGDIVLAPLSRLQVDAERIERWASFDQVQSSIEVDEADLVDLVAHVGYGPVMIVTHDCHLDREFNIEVARLRREDRSLSLEDAERQTEENPNFDRFIQVCPVLPASSVRTQWQELATGVVIGLFPVPANPDRELREDAVVDLNYRATVDRHSIVARYVALSDEARAMLRYALARHDVFRTPEIGFELEEAVGKRIRAIVTSSTSPLHVILELSDETSLELVQAPAEVRQTGSARRRFRRRGRDNS